MLDFIIVGAGPSGLYSAIELAKNGNEVIVLEEDRKIGIPRHCTGIISNDAAKLIGNAAFGSIVNKVKRAVFKYDNKSFDLSFPSDVTLVLDRIRFEELLYEEASKLGCKIFTGKRVKKIDIQKDKVVVDAGDVHYAKGLIYAAGSRPSLLPFMKTPESIPGMQYEIEGEVEDQEAVEIIFAKEAEGFFAWLAPTSSSSFLVGLANSKISPKLALDKFIEKRRIKGKISAVYSGRIVIGGALKENVFSRVAFIGDSAGHVKPTTGGGLFFGTLGSKIIGSLFPSYLESFDPKVLY